MEVGQDGGVNRLWVGRAEGGVGGVGEAWVSRDGSQFTGWRNGCDGRRGAYAKVVMIKSEAFARG